MEMQPDDFYNRVIDGYRELAKRESKRAVLIDGRKSPEAIAAEIWRILSDRFPSFAKLNI
jgi:Thymidylate kinase